MRGARVPTGTGAFSAMTGVRGRFLVKNSIGGWFEGAAGRFFGKTIGDGIDGTSVRTSEVTIRDGVTVSPPTPPRKSLLVVDADEIHGIYWTSGIIFGLANGDAITVSDVIGYWERVGDGISGTSVRVFGTMIGDSSSVSSGIN